MRLCSMLAVSLIATLSSVPCVAQSPTAAPISAQDKRVTFIHAGGLLAEPGKSPRGASTIIIDDDTIREVREGFAPPETGATLIDLKDRFVMPGLIDMHVHLWGIGGDPLRERMTSLNRDDGDDMIYAIDNARVTLEAGFTTVRDLGGNARGMRALREGVDRGTVAGPTIVNAGNSISVSGGHADGTNGVSEVFADALHQHQINTCDGPDDCRRAVRQQVALGAQVIKYMSTGGVLSNVSGGLGRAMTDEEMRAIIDTAHGLGRKVATHSHAAAGTKAALVAGVDTVDHGSFLDDETIRLFKSTGAWLVPTMIAPVAALEQARAGALPPAVIPKAEEAAAAAFASHSKAIAAGVKVAFGTDSGVSRHGENAREFSLMVKAGMTPAAAIRAATVDAAEALGRSAALGAIAPGKQADIIALTGSPLEDVQRLEKIDFVMKRGMVYKKDGARQAPL